MTTVCPSCGPFIAHAVLLLSILLMKLSLALKTRFPNCWAFCSMLSTFFDVFALSFSSFFLHFFDKKSRILAMFCEARTLFTRSFSGLVKTRCWCSRVRKDVDYLVSTAFSVLFLASMFFAVHTCSKKCEICTYRNS